MRELSGCTAVLTGAASGIGLATAAALLRAGARVAVTDSNGDALRIAVSQLEQHTGGEIASLVLDVTDPDAVEAASLALTDQLGGVQLVVTSAGVVNRGPVWELSLEQWRGPFEVNFWGTVHMMRSFVPKMIELGREGHFVCIASLASVLAREGLGPYTASKHAVLGLADVLRADLRAIAAPIGVSVVMPGAIRTQMNPVGTVEPETVADHVLDAVREDQPYAYTDRHSVGTVTSRLSAILAARERVVEQ